MPAQGGLHSPSHTWADDKIHVTPSQANAANMNWAELIPNPFMNAEFGQINIKVTQRCGRVYLYFRT